MIPIGDMIPTLNGFKHLKEVLDGYHKAIELEKEIIELNHKAQQIDALVMAEKACDAVKFDKLQKENDRLLEIIKEYKMASTGLVDYVKLRELNEGKE